MQCERAANGLKVIIPNQSFIFSILHEVYVCSLNEVRDYFIVNPSAIYIHGLLIVIFRQTEAVQAGLTASINVPLKLIETVGRVWQPLYQLAKCGNVQTKSDIQV